MLDLLQSELLLQTIAFLDVGDLLGIQRVSKRFFALIRCNRGKLRKLQLGLDIRIENLVLNFDLSQRKGHNSIRFEGFTNLRLYNERETRSVRNDDSYVVIDKVQSVCSQKCRRVLTNKPYERLSECLGFVWRNFETDLFSVFDNEKPNQRQIKSIDELNVRLNILNHANSLEVRTLPFYKAFVSVGIRTMFFDMVQPGLNDEYLLRNRGIRYLRIIDTPSGISLRGLRQVMEEYCLGQRAIEKMCLHVSTEAQITVDEAMKAIHECSALCTPDQHIILGNDGASLSVQVEQKPNSDVNGLYVELKSESKRN